MRGTSKAQILSQLQSDILSLQGFKPANLPSSDLGLDSILEAFPNRSFPVGAIHEFLTPSTESSAATKGFLAGLLSKLIGESGIAVWINAGLTPYPPAFKNFGIEPDRFLFVDVKRAKDVLWVMEESLKCAALTAVIGEVPLMDFTASRRLQLAVEQSGVTGFVLHSHSKRLNTTACVSRWAIQSLPSDVVDDLPGVGFPMWQIELLKVRNGRPGIWQVSWYGNKFKVQTLSRSLQSDQPLEPGKLKVG